MNLPIEIIATSHGAIWRDDPMQIVKKYAEWAAAYQEDQVVVAYDTMWEGTTQLAHAIAEELHKQSPETVVKVFNIAKADKNEVMTEVFVPRDRRGSPTTYNSCLSTVAGWLNLEAAQIQEQESRGVRLLRLERREREGRAGKAQRGGLRRRRGECAPFWNPEEEDFAAVPALVKAPWRKNNKSSQERRRAGRA